MQGMSWTEKVWGETRCIGSANCVEVHEMRLHTKDGKPVACSRHKHKYKHNLFVLLSGRIRLDLYLGERIESYELTAGQHGFATPGMVHRFVALENSHMIEITSADSVGEDIERLDKGHVLEDDE